MRRPPPVRTIVIQLADAKVATCRSQINQQSVEWPELKMRLQTSLKRAKKVAFVQGDDEVDFEYVADVIDTARAAGWSMSGCCRKRWRHGKTRVPGVRQKSQVPRRYALGMTRQKAALSVAPVPERRSHRNRRLSGVKLKNSPYSFFASLTFAAIFQRVRRCHLLR